MTKVENMTLDEKVDEILKYQRRFQHMAIARAVISFVIFLVIVVLPIWGFYYIANYMTDAMGMNLTEIGDTLQNVKGITEINGLEGLKSLLNL